MSPAVVQRDSAAAVAVDGTTSGAADSAMQFLSNCRVVNSTDFARHRGPACHAVTAFVRVQCDRGTAGWRNGPPVYVATNYGEYTWREGK
jgi:hypothetical protein